MNDTARSRIRFLSLVFLCVCLLIIARLYNLQVMKGDLYASKADRQYLQSGHDYFDRGSIFFTEADGDTVPAASLRTGYIVAMTPKLVEEPDAAFAALSRHIEVDADRFEEAVARVDDPYEELARRIPQKEADAIAAEKIPGIRVFRERWRFYPGNKLAAHALGFVAYGDDGRSKVGRYGLERYYEETLKRNNDSVYVNFFAELFSGVQAAVSEGASLEGDVVTWIEPTVQLQLEQELEQVNNTWSSDYSGGIIMDPKTGAIYALGASPSFDPNQFQEAESPRVFTNYLVENVYEMGSIIKPLTIAAGLDAGVITPESTYFDAGTLTLNSRTISNFDGKGRGTVSMQAVLNQSLNTGVAHVVRLMGRGEFAKYFKAFGLGEETGVDLPNETRGLVANLSSPRDIEYATASFGQGIALTPMETVRALAALANGGKLVSPHIGKEIRFRVGGKETIDPGVDVEVLKPETSEAITRMLVEVVDSSLQNGKAKMERYSIAAKTGTAQIARENGRGYYDDRYLHSFFGYFPAYEPRFIIFLYTYHPKGVRYASETLTFPFMDLAKFLINYYQIPPDR